MHLHQSLDTGCPWEGSVTLGERLSSVRGDLGKAQEPSAVSGKGQHRSFSLKKSLGNTAAQQNQLQVIPCYECSISLYGWSTTFKDSSGLPGGKLQTSSLQLVSRSHLIPSFYLLPIPDSPNPQIQPPLFQMDHLDAVRLCWVLYFPLAVAVEHVHLLTQIVKGILKVDYLSVQHMPLSLFRVLQQKYCRLVLCLKQQHIFLSSGD